MTNSKNALLAELNALLRLTQTEATIANARRAQARSTSIERELAENADNCDERALLLAKAIRDLGSIPDVVGSIAGRVSAVAKTSIEQGQSLSEALLGDLALEHQLLDRARFARVLADEAGERKVSDVLDRLEEAHTATIDWLMTRLAEIAVGGPAAIQASPVQQAVGAGRRFAQLPSRGAVEAINRSIDLTDRFQERTNQAFEANRDRAKELIAAAKEIWTAGRDASLERTEEVARQRGDKATARTVHETRTTLGALDADELPIRGYDDLNADVVIGRLERLRDVDDVRAVMAYEAANKARKGVLRTAEVRLEELASELVSAS